MRSISWRVWSTAAKPPLPNRAGGGQNDYQMRMIRDHESIEDVNDSQQTVETAPNGLDCQVLRDLATIVAHGKATMTQLILLRRVNCHSVGMLDRVPCLRIDANRHDWRAILAIRCGIKLCSHPLKVIAL